MKRIQNMADNNGNKISSLPPATNLDGTEEFVFAKGGSNGKVSFGDLWPNIPAATTEHAGVMSAADKEKVNTLGTGTLGTRVEIGTDTKIGHGVGIGFETEIGTGVIIDDQITVRNISGTIEIGTDKNNSGIQIAKIGDCGVKIGSATLGGNSGNECYIGSGVVVGDDTSIGADVVIGGYVHIDDNVDISRANGYVFGTVCRLGEGADIGGNVIISTNTSINGEHGIYVQDANIKIGEGVIISSNVLLNESGISTPGITIESKLFDNNTKIGAGATIGGIDISPTTTGLGTAVGIGNEVMIGNGVRLFNVTKDNATYHTFGKSIIGENAKVYGVVGTDTTIGTEVGIGNGVKIDDGVNLGYGVDIEKDGDDICFMKRLPDYADITLKSGSYLGGAVYEDVKIGTGVEIYKEGVNDISIGSAYLGESAKVWGSAEIGTAVNIVGVNITGYDDRVVISNGEGKTLTLSWDN